MESIKRNYLNLVKLAKASFLSFSDWLCTVMELLMHGIYNEKHWIMQKQDEYEKTQPHTMKIVYQ